MRMAGQRIVARLRESTYASALRQEVEFVEREKGTGDVMSRLTSDASIVGESYETCLTASGTFTETYTP
jgi:ABC-type multidrug transport system fused ATPase/permease subunit